MTLYSSEIEGGIYNLLSDLDTPDADIQTTKLRIRSRLAEIIDAVRAEDRHARQAVYMAKAAVMPAPWSNRVVCALLSVGERIAELTQEIRRGNDARL